LLFAFCAIAIGCWVGDLAPMMMVHGGLEILLAGYVIPRVVFAAVSYIVGRRDKA
jgi:hypothetical protein